MFIALLDTCVLWPSLQRDFLLSLAIEGMYRPVWSHVILQELEHHEAVKLIERGAPPGDARQRARRLMDRVRASFNDAEVQGWEPLEGTFDLPDPDDEHVVAAAVVANAGAIVTNNLKDFPTEKVPTRIQVLPPTAFAVNTVAVNPIRARAAIAAVADRSGKRGPKLTEQQVLDLLVDRYRMTDAVELIGQHL